MTARNGSPVVAEPATIGPLPHAVLTLAIRVDGDPVGQQRPRCTAYRVGGRCIARAYAGHRRPGTPAGERDHAWRTALRDAALESSPGRIAGMHERPVSLALDFALGRPRAHFRTGRFSAMLRDDAPPSWDTSGSALDLSNATKYVEDEWQGTEAWSLFADDRQVVRYDTPHRIRWADPGEVPGLSAVVRYLAV